MYTKMRQNYGLWFLFFLHIYAIFRPSEIIFFNTFYPIYILALLIIYLNSKKLPFLLADKKIKIIFSLILSLIIISVFNSIINEFYNKRLLFTWIAWLAVVVAVILSSPYSDKHYSRLELLAKSVLLIQLIISIVQLFEPHFFSLFWSSIENRGLDRDVRVSGSLANPIIFSYIISYLVLVVIARKGPVKNIFWVMLGCLLILMSGSRSLVMTYPILIGAWFYLGNGKLLKRLFYSSSYAISLFIISYLLLYFFKELFVYSAEILVIFQSENNGINSGGNVYNENLRTFGYRVDYWNAALSDFFSRDILSVIVGKSGPYLSTPHHDLIYMLSRYGAIGLISYLTLHFWLLEIALKNKYTAEGRLVYLTILMSLTVGMANTIGVEMRLGIFSALVAGLLLSRERYSKVISNIEIKSSIEMDKEIQRVSSTKSFPA